MSRKLEIFEKVLTEPYDNHSFINFIRELLNDIELVAPNLYNKVYNNFSYYVDGYYHIGNYTGIDGNKIAVFSVALKRGTAWNVQEPCSETLLNRCWNRECVRGHLWLSIRLKNLKNGDCPLFG